MRLAASSFEVPDGLLATRAAAQLNPKPHQGLSSKNPATHLPLDDANSTVAIGLRAGLALNGLRQSERARYYGSALGRFTSPDDPDNDQDPKDPQSWNLYSYVRNNPLKNIDPFGQDCITISNQTSSGATVTTERGGSAETCSGTYVEGTVNTNSYQYNGTSLSYSFSNDTASGAGTIAFSKYSNDDWAPGSSNMLGAAQIGGSQALVNEFMKQAVIGAAAGVAGRVIGAGVDAFLAARAARAAAAAVDLANLSNKIVRQMASRGWTTQEILETVQNGKAYNVVNKATGGAATEYVNPASGKFVVVDNATKQVLQVSGPGFSPNHLIQ